MCDERENVSVAVCVRNMNMCAPFRMRLSFLLCLSANAFKSSSNNVSIVFARTMYARSECEHFECFFSYLCYFIFLVQMFSLTCWCLLRIFIWICYVSLSPSPSPSPSIELLRERENRNIQINIKSSIFPDSFEQFT